ncbi:MAG: PriCT-2 domain-containing protein, partial [Clostridiales Family XIII bacterium]|nr:PriCT-2 domain-containing protein [Clostridiales Family XIII bacterium]
MIGRCGYDLTAILGWLDPATCTYEEWVQVGMALKLEGHECGEWDGWSAHDTARFHPGECERKWRSFGNSPASPVTGGTLVEIARVHGWMPSYTEQTFGWDDTLPADCWEPPDGALFDPSWLEDEEIEEPDAWDPVKDTIAYLSALFDSEDYVGYVTESYEKDGRHIPGKGIYTRTAGELVADLGKRGGDLGKALGDYNPDVGAWVRFNPLDGQGVRNANVTEFRYALVESDTLPIERQNALIRSLQLPVACLVHSGGKSLHAIVRIDAKDYDEYRSRVDFLYSECRKNGLDVDTQNKNPSRLSRLPGVLRAGQRQALLATGIGKASWDEWRQWYEAEQDVFPDITPFAQEAGLDLPDPEMVVAGMLAKGDKMMLAGPSKAGKTFALLELAIAVAEGTGWMGRRCTGGDVLYINLEIKRDARIRRMRAIYEALGLTMANA